MSNFELYIGGPATRNQSLAMFPAVPFNAAQSPFNKIGVAAHKGPSCFNDKRVLDFSTDRALQEFARNNAVVATDVLGVVLVPRNILFMGFYYKVVKPQAGLTLTPRLRVKGTAYTAIDCSVVAEGFVAPAGGAIVTQGAVSMAGVLYDNAPDMFDLTVTALPASKFGNFSAIFTVVGMTVDQGGGP